MTLTLQALQKRICFRQSREQLLLGVELGGVDAAAAAAQSDGMLQVQHLVVDDVLDGVAGDGEVIEDSADDDGIVGGVVVAEDAACPGRAPAHARASHESVKKTRVEIFENCVKIVEVPLWRAQKFAAAHLADQMGFADNFMAGNIFSVASGVAAIDGLAVHLGKKDVGDGVKNRVGGAFQEIREPYQQPTLAKANGVVYVGEGEKFDL